jgi:hypothetical protein
VLGVFILATPKRGAIFVGMAGLILAFAPVCFSQVANGGFETGGFSDWAISGSYACVASSACGGNSFDSNADPGPHSGSYAAYLGGCSGYSDCGGEDVLSQTLTTVPGQNYTLRFFLAAPTSGGTSTPNSFTIKWSGATVGTITNLTSDSYVEYSYSVTGSGSDVLEFDSSDYPTAFVLDDVSVGNSPGNVTGATAAATWQVALQWTNPADADLASIVILRSTSVVTDVPAQGVTYVVGNMIGASTVACVVASPGTSCTDTGLTLGTGYYYEIFTVDTSGDYSSGVVPSGSPGTPQMVFFFKRRLQD